MGGNKKKLLQNLTQILFFKHQKFNNGYNFEELEKKNKQKKITFNELQI